MGKYLLIESRDPFDSNDTANFQELACALAAAGNEVTLFLVQNGVLPARPGGSHTGLSAVAAGGVEILADEFALGERGISPRNLIAGVTPAPLERLVDQLAEGRKALWH